MTKVGVIIPSRGDRPEFLKNCLRQLDSQTLQPVEVCLVAHPPTSSEKDLTARYKLGYDTLRKKGLEVILLIEDDDYYAPEYIQSMVDEWHKQGKPLLLGTNYTLYYNLRYKGWLTFHHNTRSSAMSTLIAPDLNFKWCADNEPYFDIHIWNEIAFKDRKIFHPEKHICIGIKHGLGLCGGEFHTNRKDRIEHCDPQHNFLREQMTKESYDFFTSVQLPDNSPAT